MTPQTHGGKEKSQKKRKGKENSRMYNKTHGIANTRDRRSDGFKNRTSRSPFLFIVCLREKEQPLLFVTSLFCVCVDTGDDAMVPLKGLQGELFLRLNLLGAHVDDFLCEDLFGGLCRVDTGCFY